MRIAIMGSGGLGGYFGARLLQGGADVHFVARGKHLDAMRSSGLRIVGPEPIHVEAVQVTDPRPTQEPAWQRSTGVHTLPSSQSAPLCEAKPISP